MPQALVTGASSGIGFELARLFARDGYDVVVAADDDEIFTAADDLAAEGTDIRAVQADLKDPAAIDDLYSTATGGGARPLSAAALNAGTGRAGRFIDGEMVEDIGIVDLNVRSTVRLAKRVLKDMAERGEGRVLFTSSLVATMPGSHQTMYNASKSFIQSFAEALQDELRDTAITITSLMPGPTDTNFFARAGMLNTLVGKMPKDDPAQVARQGFEALMSGDKNVVGGSVSSKVIGTVSRVLPDTVKAVGSRLISMPRGS